MPSLNHNRRKRTKLARTSECFQISNRAAAAIANSAMHDLGMVADDKTYIIDHSKLQIERERCCAEVKKKEQENFKLMFCTLIGAKIQHKSSRKGLVINFTEQYNLITTQSLGKPVEYYLVHFPTDDGKRRALAQKILTP